MNELERCALILRRIEPATASQFGAEVYSGRNGAHRTPQAYARPGANLLREMSRFGLAKQVPSNERGRSYVWVAGSATPRRATSGESTR